MIPGLAVAGLLVGALATFADASGRRRLFWFTKPLAMLLILAVALLRLPLRPQAGLWIVVGLALGLIGDILLLLPQERFVLGLASFLLAQLCYLYAFTRDAPAWGSLWLAAPFVLLVLGAWRALLPGAGKLRAPVALYVVVIAAMAWRAIVRHETLLETRTLLGVAGAVLFCISDLALAWRRFVRSAPWLAPLCLATYYVAQTLIALSI